LKFLLYYVLIVYIWIVDIFSIYVLTWNLID
jgi:hypothetical protein